MPGMLMDLENEFENKTTVLQKFPRMQIVDNYTYCNKLYLHLN